MKKLLTVCAVAAVVLTLSVAGSIATPKIAKQSGKKCEECHGTADNGGGGGGPHEKSPGGKRNK